jgi:hypothetical protein
VAIAGLGIRFVPPAQADEAAAGDVLQVVEVGGEQEDGDDEDKDEVGGEEDAEEVNEEGGFYNRLLVGGGGLEEEVIDVQARKARKVTRVMGWALRRQFSEPGSGFWMSAMVVGIGVAIALVRRTVAMQKTLES